MQCILFSDVCLCPTEILKPDNENAHIQNKQTKLKYKTPLHFKTIHYSKIILLEIYYIYILLYYILLEIY